MRILTGLWAGWVVARLGDWRQRQRAKRAREENDAGKIKSALPPSGLVNLAAQADIARKANQISLLASEILTGPGTREGPKINTKRDWKALFWTVPFNEYWYFQQSKIGWIEPFRTFYYKHTIYWQVPFSLQLSKISSLAIWATKTLFT